jgi:hypothetical protein
MQGITKPFLHHINGRRLLVVTKTNVAYIITHRHIGHHSSHCNFTHSLPYTSLCSKPTLPNSKLTLQPRTESLAMQMSPEMQLSQSQGKCQTPDCTKNHRTVQRNRLCCKEMRFQPSNKANQLRLMQNCTRCSEETLNGFQKSQEPGHSRYLDKHVK